MANGWKDVIIKLFLVLVSLFVVTDGRDANCGCDHIKRVVKCSQMKLTDLKEMYNVCGDYETVDISENNILKFPNNLHQFRYVNISYNFLKNLDVSVNQRVEILDITGNDIRAINVKDYFSNLRLLNASKNSLGFGAENFIQGHCNILHLDVSENMILSLQSVTKCTQLFVLVAVDNAISYIPENLSSLTNLKTLDLARNKLMYVRGLPPNLERLDISGNKITNINPVMFQGLAMLTFLNLDGNKIKIIEPGTFSSLGSLQTLKLNTNDMTRLTREMFQGLKSLKVAEFCSNLLVEISDDTFSDLPALEKLFLAENQLETLPALLLGKNVKVVQFMMNSIEYWNFQSLMTMFSGSAVRRRVSLPLNKNYGDDSEWIKVVRVFDWECVEWLTLVVLQLNELPDHPPRKDSLWRIFEEDDGECVCVRFTDSGGMNFDTCVTDVNEIDGFPWILAMGMAAEREQPSFARSDL